jgi:transposase
MRRNLDKLIEYGFIGGMRKLYVRELTKEEKVALQKGLRSSDAFTVRHSQILLSSAEGQSARVIAEQLHCSDQCVREAIHAFHGEGLKSVARKSTRPHSATFSFDEQALQRLPDIVNTSPRRYGHAHSLWSLERLAATCYAEGLTKRLVNINTMSEALKRAGIDWQRARRRMNSTDPAYEVKKTP